jgi:anaerobic selenocysteine-containing dehydrogenase
VVIWGTNAASHPGQRDAPRHARPEERGAKIVAVDIYENATTAQADLPLILKPGTDGALACAVMHVLFRDGWADRDYLARRTDDPEGLEAHLASAHARLGGGDHRAVGDGDRGLRRAGRHAQAQLFPPRLRLHPPAQRRGRDACGKLSIPA